MLIKQCEIQQRLQRDYLHHSFMIKVSNVYKISTSLSLCLPQQ